MNISETEQNRRRRVVYGFSKRNHTPDEVTQIYDYLEGGDVPSFGGYSRIDSKMPAIGQNVPSELPQIDPPTRPSSLGSDLTQPIAGLTRNETGKLIVFFSDITCGENCWSAKEEICRCSCNGRNHGISLRGGQAQRTCKIDARRYVLFAVGTHKQLREQVEQLVRDYEVSIGKRQLREDGYYSQSYSNKDSWFKSSYIHPDSYHGKGSAYVLRYATLSQCVKWHELSYFDVMTDRDRYKSDAAILWKREDIINE